MLENVLLSHTHQQSVPQPQCQLSRPRNEAVRRKLITIMPLMMIPLMMMIIIMMKMLMPQLLMMMYVLAIISETFQLHDCEFHE